MERQQRKIMVGIWWILGLFSWSMAAASTLFQYERFVDVWSYYYVVPEALLNVEDMEAIGLKKMVETGRLVDMNSLGRVFTINALNDQKSRFLPQNASLMFLFNTSSKMEVPPVSDNVLSEQFIQTSLPFGLPQYHYMANSFLLVPKVDVDSESVRNLPLVSGDVWIDKLGFDRTQIPLSREVMGSPNKPIMTFMFQCGENLNEFNTTVKTDYRLLNASDSYWLAKKRISDVLVTSSSEVAKAVIASSDEFFDKFARLWINTLGYDVLLNSVFCQVNTRVHELSYCLRISENGLMISLVSKGPANIGTQTTLETTPTSNRNLKNVQKRDLFSDGYYNEQESEQYEDDGDYGYIGRDDNIYLDELYNDEGDSEFDEEDDDCDETSKLDHILGLKHSAKKVATNKLRHILDMIYSHIPDCDEEEELVEEDDCEEDSPPMSTTSPVPAPHFIALNKSKYVFGHHSYNYFSG